MPTPPDAEHTNALASLLVNSRMRRQAAILFSPSPQYHPSTGKHETGNRETEKRQTFPTRPPPGELPTDNSSNPGDAPACAGHPSTKPPGYPNANNAPSPQGQYERTPTIPLLFLFYCHYYTYTRAPYANPSSVNARTRARLFGSYMCLQTHGTLTTCPAVNAF